MLKRICALLLALCLSIGLCLPMIPTAEASAYKTGVFTSAQGKFLGIDVSEHQGQINWDNVAKSNVKFAIIRCGFGQDQTNQDDDWFRYNVKECNRVGIPFGLYLYNYATTTSGASGEADHAIRLINECKGYSNFRLPMYYDLEESSLYAKDNATVKAIMQTFEKKVEEATGVTVGVYANTSWFNNKLTDSYYKTIPAWCAQYNYRCDYTGTYDIWQYSSSGSIGGISGRCDVNYARVDSLSDLYYGGSAPSSTATVVTDKSTYKVGEAIMVTANSNASDAWVGVYPQSNNLSASLMWYWVADYAGESVNVLNARYTGNEGYQSRTDNTKVYQNWGDGFGSYMNDNGGAYWGTLKPGTYTIGVYTGDGGTPLASKTITISGSGFGSTLSTDKSLYYGQESEHIYVTASSDNTEAWVGLYKSSVTDYRNSPSYVWYSLYGRNKEVTDICWDYSGYNPNQGGYTWPLQNGTYKVVLFKDNNYTVDKVVNFTIGNPSLTTDKSTYCVKQPIKVSTNYTSSGSWIGLYGSSDTPGTQTSLYWYYTDTNKTSGVDIKSETNERGGSFGAGTYKLIQFADSTYSKQVATKTITVVNCSANSGSHNCKYCNTKLTNCSDSSTDSDHKCDTCGAAGVTSCSYDQQNTGSGFLKSGATCTSAAVYYKSCRCGAKSSAIFTSGSKNANNHVNCSLNWVTNATQHTRKYSACGAVTVGTENHHWSNGKCSECGYVCNLTTDSNKDHKCDTCGKAVTSCTDTNPKDHKCDICGKTGMGTHAGTSTSHTCAYCNQKASDCVDTNPTPNGKCDICGVDVAHACVDSGKDHACDICSAAMGTHAAAAGKHTCDYCNKIADTGCKDADPKDHKCDICGQAYGDPHEAAQGSHNCTYCSGKVTECSDKTGDNDHDCDVCDAPNTTKCADNATDGDHNCDECGEPASVCADASTDDDHKCDDCGQTLGECADGSDEDDLCDECGALISKTSMTVAKTTIELGEGLLVTATSNVEGDWIGIYNEGVTPADGENEAFYWYFVEGSWNKTWVNGNTYNLFTQEHDKDHGDLTGLPVGTYDLFLLGADYTQKHKITITVTDVADGEKPEPSLTVSKNVYAYGEEVRYTATSYKENPWIGLYEGTLTAESEIPTSLSWQHVQGRNGVEDTWGAQNPGDYSIVLFDDLENYIVDDVVNFTVEESDAPMLAVDKTEYEVGEPIMVTTNYMGNKAWVGLYKQGEDVYNPNVEGGVASIFWYYLNEEGNPVDIRETRDENERGGDYGVGEFKVVLFSSDYNAVTSKNITIKEAHVCVDADPKDHMCDSCGEELSKCADNNSDHKCDVCKAELGKCADNNSDHKCDTCKAELSKCADGNSDHKCDTCKAELSKCADGNSDHKCDVCKAELSKCADGNSDHKCDTCKAELSKCADNNSDHKCDTCKAELSKCADGNSDHKCDVCKADLSKCADNNSDHKCDTCKAELSKCADGNSDHKCDVCKAELSKCADGNSDHKCDTCKAELSKCADGNNDHKCDVCSAVLSECADTNADGKCDTCGATLTQPEDPKPEDPKPEDPKDEGAEDSKEEEPKPEDPKDEEPEDPKEEEPKPEDPKDEEPEDPKEEEPEDEPKPEQPALEGVARLAGNTRYDTAFLAADTLKAQLGLEKFDTIIVSSGEQFADALAGSYLAAVKNAPILLMKDRNKEIDAVKAYIKENLTPGGTVYLLGGINAVPAKMETGLDGYNVERLGGNDRYATNLLILEEAGVAGKDIVVCTGKEFADSLSASAVGLPILLVKDKLNDKQLQFMAGNTGKIYVIGGKNAVSERAESQLKNFGEVIRLAGNTRYDTSALVAKTFFANPTSIVLAYGKNFPDGLSGGPVAFAMGAPLILTEAGKEKVATAYVAEFGITSGYVQGGINALPDKTVRKVFNLTADDPILVK